MYYEGFDIPTKPGRLGRDPRFLNPNWTNDAGATLAELACAGFIRNGMTEDEANAEVDYLWAQATIVATAEAPLVS